RQEDDSFGDLRGLAGAAAWKLGVQFRPAVLVAEEPFGARHDMREMAARHGRTRVYGNDAHAMPHAFPPEALREHVERDVGGAACDIAMVGVARGGPDDVDDHAAAARAHAAIDNAG